MFDQAAKKGNVVEERHVAAPYAGQDQHVLSLPGKLCRRHHVIGIRSQKKDEELCLYGIDSNAAVANRTPDEGIDFVLSVVEQKLVARTHRNISERCKRIAGDTFTVSRQSANVPFCFKE
jgi:hypothetical protein